ncbi:transposase [Croceicoccus estronivorus]|uniref:transposase n=1 Tax=Croceicoccus estronivorus TaxID=1172626 RepID=UPI0012E7D7CB
MDSRLFFGGRPPEQNRAIVNGILWRLWCGAPWRDVPPKYGSWNTIYRRFRRWSEAGVWETVAVTLAEIMADSGHYSIDSTTVRAHVSVAGGKGGLIDALLAARGAGSPVSFIAWRIVDEWPLIRRTEQNRRYRVNWRHIPSVCFGFGASTYVVRSNVREYRRSPPRVTYELP